MIDSAHLKYLAVSPFDLNWGVAVNTAGYQDILPGMSYPPVDHPTRYLFSAEKGRVLNEYQLLYITNGRGEFRSASLEHPVHVGKGSMFILFPGEWHSYRPDPDTGWKEYWIGFQGSQMDSWVDNQFFTKEKPVLDVGMHNGIIDLYNNAINVAANQESGFQQLLASIVTHLLGLAYFYDRNKVFQASELSSKINRAKQLIAERYNTLTPEAVAALTGMSYSSFRKIFKEYTGFSPAKYILDLRFSKAKEALTNTTLSVREVASLMGFENYEYFFTAFRKMSGMTPSEYRAVTQGKTL